MSPADLAHYRREIAHKAAMNRLDDPLRVCADDLQEMLAAYEREQAQRIERENAHKTTSAEGWRG